MCSVEKLLMENQEVKFNINMGFLSLLSLLFIYLKLVGKIAWAWKWVLAPIWIPVAILFVILFFILVCAIIAAMIK